MYYKHGVGEVVGPCLHYMKKNFFYIVEVVVVFDFFGVGTF